MDDDARRNKKPIARLLEAARLDLDAATRLLADPPVSTAGVAIGVRHYVALFLLVARYLGRSRDFWTWLLGCWKALPTGGNDESAP